MKLCLAIMLFVAFAAYTAAAQDAKTADLKKAEMKKVERWAGQWRGSGWAQYGPKRETFTGGELVQKKLDGLALLVEGKFTNAEGKVIHETLAVLSYDDKARGFAFDTFLATGSAGNYVLKVLPETFEWGFETPGGTIRFTIRIDNDVWFEIGEFSPDGGKTWIKTFEMKLERVK